MCKMLDIKFGHMSDLHIGRYSQDPKLSRIEQEGLGLITDECIKKKVDFIIISGDLFHSHIIDLSILDDTIKKLKKVRDAGIQIYTVHGSHDYCSGGKSVLDVLCSTGLVTDVFKYKNITDKLRLEFTIDEKTGVKLVGIPGEIGNLEDRYYNKLDKEYLENEKGVKIFIFHSAIEGLVHMRGNKDDDIKIKRDNLPKGFDYYAGGHIHTRSENNNFLEEYKCIVFPGIPFALSFEEIREDTEDRGYYIVHLTDKIDLDTRKPRPCRYLIDKCHIEDDQSIEKLIGNISRYNVGDNDIACVNIEGPYVLNKTLPVKERLIAKLKEKGIANRDINTTKKSLPKRSTILPNSTNNPSNATNNPSNFSSIDVKIEDIFKKHFDMSRISNIVTDERLKGDAGILLAKELLKHICIPMDVDDKANNYKDNMIKTGLAIFRRGDIQ